MVLGKWGFLELQDREECYIGADRPGEKESEHNTGESHDAPRSYGVGCAAVASRLRSWTPEWVGARHLMHTR